MDISVYGKTALIGGSTQGIGLAIAEELAIAGANCMLFARNEEQLKDIVAALTVTGSQKHGYRVADYAKTEEVREAIASVLAEQPVHILINNTGGPRPGLASEASEEEFLEAFQQHLINNHVLAKAVVPGMKEAGYGRIINIISTSVRIPIANLGVSNTIRAAVASWAKTLSNELGQFNITVNNILPGLTDTQRLQGLITAIAEARNLDRAIIEREMIGSIPVKRFGLAKEIANVAAFLASPAASYINGVSLPVDGGRTGSI